MNQPKRNLKIWIPIAAVLCFWLGNWMGYTYELTEGTTTHRLTAALNLNSLLLHPAWLQQSNGHVRGRLRGLLSVLHAHTLGDLATVSDVPGLPGRKVLLVAAVGRNGAAGSVAFDITGPWGSA